MSAIVISCKKSRLQKISTDEIANLPAEQADSLRIRYTEDGKLKNEIFAKTAKRYRFVDTPYYEFPHGIYAATYNNDEPETDVVADSVIMQQNPENFFIAYGNVVVRNMKKNTKMETQGPLYWDTGAKKIYTDAYAVIFSAGDTIKAYDGLTSDDQFHLYELRTLRQGVVYKEFEKREHESETSVSDTVQKQ